MHANYTATNKSIVAMYAFQAIIFSLQKLLLVLTFTVILTLDITIDKTNGED